MEPIGRKSKMVFSAANRGAAAFVVGVIGLVLASSAEANPDAKRLYDDLLSNYNRSDRKLASRPWLRVINCCYTPRLIRPVGNSSDRLTVKMGLKLSQIIGVDMKRQIMITNVWVEQVG